MDHGIRPIAAEELPAFARVLYPAFGLQAGDEEIDEARAVTELDRTLAVFDGAQPVAIGAALSMRLTLPGLTVVPAAGVTAVAVLPTHRRRGMLTALMARQLDDVAAAGETVAALAASESTIYGRFGYGRATDTVSAEIERAHAALADAAAPPGTVRIIETQDMAGVLPSIHDRHCAGQPGELTRTPGWWEVHLRDPERDRDGGSARFGVVYEAPDGSVDGYVTYRMKGDPWAWLPEKVLVVEELVSVTDQARAALWRYCLSVDLVRLIQAPVLPVDEPLRWMLADSRRLQTTSLHDALWIRLVDVAAALAARRYAVAGSLVVEVADAFRPAQAGRYRLDGGPQGADCRRTTESADLALDVSDLASLFLGGVRASTLARAGRVAELRRGALARADLIFAAERAPFCGTDF